MEKLQFNLTGGWECVRRLNQACAYSGLCVTVFNTTNKAQSDDRHSVSKPPAERRQEAVSVFQLFTAAFMPATA